MRNKRRNLTVLAVLLLIIVSTVLVYVIDSKKFYSTHQSKSSEYLFKMTYLVVDKNKTSEKITMDQTFYEDHIDDLLFTAIEMIPLEKNGDYLYANLKDYANESLFNDISDYVFALNDNDGNVIKDCEFDKNNLSIKIPISYYNNKTQIIPVQMAIESRMSQKDVLNVKINTRTKKLFTKNKVRTFNNEDNKTSISVASYGSKLNKEDIEIYVNNTSEKVDSKSFEYDKKAGVVTLDMPALLINNIDIKINKIALITKVGARTQVSESNMHTINLGTKKPSNGSYSVTLSGTDNGLSGKFIYCGEHPDFCSSNNLFIVNGTSEGAGTLWVSYYWTYVKPSDLSVYSSIPGYYNASDDRFGNDTLFVYPYAINLKTIGSTPIDFSEWDTSSTSSWVAMPCVHPGQTALSYPSDPGSGGIKLSVTAVSYDDTNNTALYRFASSFHNTQAALAYIRVKWNEKSDLAVIKDLDNCTDDLDSADKQFTFKLYNTNSSGTCTNQCSGTALQTITLKKSSGYKGKFTDLLPNTSYCVGETLTTAQSNVFDTTNSDKCVKMTTLGPDDTPKYDDAHTFTNVCRNRSKCCVKVKKVDAESTSTALKGVSFNIFGEGVNVTKQTNSTGTVTFTNLDCDGVYDIYEQETNPIRIGKSNYWVDMNQRVTVEPDDLTEMSNGKCPTNTAVAYTFKNYKQYYCAKVVKVMERDNALYQDLHNSDALLKGASFSAKINGETVTVKDSDDGNDDGVGTFFLESQDPITVTETTAPSGYHRSYESMVVVPFALPANMPKADAKGYCNFVTPNIYNGRFTLSEIDESGHMQSYTVPEFENTPLVLNWFKFTEDGESKTKANGAEFIVKVHGENKYVKVKSTTNTVETIDAPYEYETYSSTSEKVEYRRIAKSCYKFDKFVTAKSSASTLKSIDTNTQEASSDENYVSNNPDVLDSNGEVCISGIPKGSYDIIETKPVSGHTFGSNATLENKTANAYFRTSNTSYKFENLPTVFEFTKTVRGSNYDEFTLKELKLIPFNIYKIENGSITGDPIKFRKTSDGVYEYAANSIDGPGSNTGTEVLYLNDSRKFTVYHLPEGNYAVKEKKNCCGNVGCCTGSSGGSECSGCDGTNDECNGYYYPDYSNESTYKFTITKCSNPSADSDACTTRGKVTKTLENVPTSIELTKSDLYNYADESDKVKFEDEEERSAFDQITFNLKNISGQKVSLVFVGNHSADASNPCSGDNDYSEYRYVRSSILGNTETTEDLHTCGGHIKITNLCRGRKYTIEEVSVPENSVFTLANNSSKTYVIPYSIENGVGKACCSNPSETPNSTAEIEDKPTEIIINKKNINPSEDIHENTTVSARKQTAKFKVYRCKNKNNPCTKALADANPIKFRPLANLGNTSKKTYKYVLNQSQTTNTVTELELTTVDNKGQIILNYLPANYTYVVVETNAPDGYYNVEGAFAELSVNVSTTETNTFDKNNYPTMIKFTKDDLYKYYRNTDWATTERNNKIFDTMTFTLRDGETGEVVRLVKVSNGEYRFIQKDGSIPTSNTTNSTTELHTNSGSLVITHLYRGRVYYIEETKTDTEGHFALATNIKKPSGIPTGWNWQGHPYVKYNISNSMPSNTNNGTEVPESLTELMHNIPTRVVFEKRDKSTGELIDDEKNMILNQGKADSDKDGIHYGTTRTTFEVYYCEKNVTTCLPSSNNKVYFTPQEYIVDDDGHDITSDLNPSNSDAHSPFKAYKFSKLNDSTGDVVSELITDRGLLVIAYLPSNYKYVLHEKTAPNGYYQPDSNDPNLNIQFTVESETHSSELDYIPLTSKNENTPTEIYFEKSDIYDYYQYENIDVATRDSSIKLLDTARFKLYDSNGNVLKLKFVEENEQDGRVYRYLPYDERDNKEEKIYTLNGKLKITHLYRNSIYYIEEVETTDPEHFILPNDLHYENLPFDNNGHPVVKYIVPNTAPSDKTSVTAEIQNIPTRVRFEKRDSKYGYLIPDETTTFKVYQCKINTTCHPADGITSDMTLMNFTERGIISGDREDPNDAEGLSGVEVYKYNKLNNEGVTELHPYRGLLVLRYLPAGYNYVLLETTAPKNYTLPQGRDAETPFTVSNSTVNTVEVNEIDVPNKPTSLLVRKYSEDGKLLPGAEFKIYHVTHYDENRTAENQQKELIKLKTIREGLYDAREITDTNVIKTCKDNELQKCSDINTTITYDSYLDTWTNFEENSVNQNQERVQIQEGEALIQYLEYGNYYVIEEVKAPDGYELPKKSKDRFHLVHIVQEVDVLDTEKTLINKPVTFTFYKLDEYDNPLDGGKFKLQKLNNDKVYEDVPVTKVEEENATFYKVDSDSKDYLIETIDGKATIYNLVEGQYRILETEAPEGKELPKKTVNVVTFFVDSVGNVYGSNIIANKSKTEKITYNPKAHAELIVNVQTGQVRVKYSLIIILLLVSITVLLYLQGRKKRGSKNEKDK